MLLKYYATSYSSRAILNDSILSNGKTVLNTVQEMENA